MITLRTKPTDKLIELGGGANPKIRPNVDVRQCFDGQGKPTVDFTANFEEPLPIQSEEWDGVYSEFVIEHISWRKVKQFIGEVFRILKPGGKAVFVTANTEAQMQWVQTHGEGWDGKDGFESCSCILFGDQDYPENAHKNFMSAGVATSLFQAAGFENITIQPYGAAATDMVIEAQRPQGGVSIVPDAVAKEEPLKAPAILAKAFLEAMPREEMFDRQYFDGGGKVGGYAREGYWDFPVHEITARHVLARKPESVLELGAARGYIVKRLQDAAIRTGGLEISKHCFMTRVANGIWNADICRAPWPVETGYDLCFSIATLEHIPEEFLPVVIAEMERTCKRGLHGIDFGAKDDGFDKTHCTLKPKSFWQNILPKGHEVVDKEELERGDFPEEIIKGDGKVKLNVGSFTTMFHHGWINIDVHDLTQHAQAYRYNFLRHDVRQGLPYPTGGVDLIFACHFLEHLTYSEGLAFLRECRRVIRPTGHMRVLVPDAGMLMESYYQDAAFATLVEFDEINVGCANSSTSVKKLWSLLHEGHFSCYDPTTMIEVLKKADFVPTILSFRQSRDSQIMRETLDLLPCLTLYTDAKPEIG